MKAKLELMLAGLAPGRIVLHLAACLVDHHWRWHAAGILRELRRF